MKILLVVVAVIFSGFSTDTQKNKEVTVPMRFDGAIITDQTTETVCTPAGDPFPYIAHARKGWLQGNVSHGGKLNAGQSTWTIFNCQTDFASKVNTSNIEGVNTLANGDLCYYTCIMLTNISTMEVVLNITFIGGTGRYMGVVGHAVLTGVNTGSGYIPISGWGSLTFAK